MHLQNASTATVIRAARRMKCAMARTANACANPALLDAVATDAMMPSLGIRLAASAIATTAAPKHPNAIQ